MGEEKIFIRAERNRARREAGTKASSEKGVNS